jgi:signal transduction histidine kinase
VVGFTALGGVGSVVGAGMRYGWSLGAAVAFAVLLQSGALWWRRRYPMAVLLVVIAVELAAIAISPDREPGGVAVAFAVYAVSVYGQPRVRMVVAASAIAVILAAVVVVIFGYLPAARVLIPAGAFSLVAWVIGDYVRSRRRFITDLVTRHRQEREQAAEEERLRIARELHDVVAHNVSVMAIQAGAARVSGSSSVEALESIEKGARDTLAELNKLLGVLRKSPGAAGRTPQPTLDEVEALLKPARDAGLEAALKVTGDRRRVSAAVDMSAYRIIQEAITNVLKHANASRVEVVIDYQPDALALTISDNGTGRQSDSSNGHGLIGMRERVALFGGDLSTGSSSLGGFTVRATLPVKA